jgi:hypothetical protein
VERFEPTIKIKDIKSSIERLIELEGADPYYY